MWRSRSAPVLWALVVMWDRDLDAVAAQYPDVGVVRFALRTQDPKAQVSALLNAIERGVVGPGGFVVLCRDEPPDTPA